MSQIHNMVVLSGYTIARSEKSYVGFEQEATEIDLDNFELAAH